MYEIFESLIKERGITAYRVYKETGVSQSTLSDWKNGKSIPSAQKLKLIADYLGVTVDFFMGSDQNKKAPALTEKDKRDVAKEVERIMGDLQNSGELMFDGVPISAEARESMAAAMKLGLEAARLRNKETYTPKKYRK